MVVGSDANVRILQAVFLVGGADDEPTRFQVMCTPETTPTP
jgi:hypothetical protein